RVDVTMLPIVGPEVVTGSTRMKAGTATKLVLNTITTGAMIRLGKTYGNLMVDLRATNNKLVDRSQRIVMEVCGVSRDEATRLLERSGKSVKTAIVMQKKGIDKEAAERLLAENGGIIRRITKDEPPPIRES
ncbi:MAG TPA: N-acetylmuramic acid 6-phosphate etherase, partial [Gemmatimonadaceae bacterium]|nr:N-acetylmuramic acid 6-phosphate etherase [Gemmatimonadaceae bacterium]